VGRALSSLKTEGLPSDRQRAGDLQRVLNETRGKHGDNDITYRN